MYFAHYFDTNRRIYAGHVYSVYLAVQKVPFLETKQCSTLRMCGIATTCCDSTGRIGIASQKRHIVTTNKWANIMSLAIRSNNSTP